MAGIGKIFQMAGVNSDPRTARKAGRDARKALPVATGSAESMPETSLGPAAIVDLSPEARALLAKKDKNSPAAMVTLPAVAASFGLVGYKGGFFKRERKA